GQRGEDGPGGDRARGTAHGWPGRGDRRDDPGARPLLAEDAGAPGDRVGYGLPAQAFRASLPSVGGSHRRRRRECIGGLVARECIRGLAAREFRLPDIGEGLTAAEIVRWLVPVGGYVAQDQPVVEVETDKAVVEIPSPYAGVVLEHGGAEGETIAVGAVLVVV